MARKAGHVVSRFQMTFRDSGAAAVNVTGRGFHLRSGFKSQMEQGPTVTTLEKRIHKS